MEQVRNPFIANERFRFPIPSFWTGLASTLSLAAAFAPTFQDLYGEALTPHEVDARALAVDTLLLRRDAILAVWELETEIRQPAESVERAPSLPLTMQHP